MIAFLSDILGFGREIYGDFKAKKKLDDIKRKAIERLIVILDNEQAKQDLKQRQSTSKQ